MEVDNYINKKKQLYNIFINYIECDCESEEDFDLLIKMINDQKITNSNSEFKRFFKLLLSVFKNHHRNQYFYTKIEKLFVFFKDDMMNAFTNFEIFELFKYEKHIYLILLNNKILEIDQDIANIILKKLHKSMKFFFYPEIKEFINDENLKEKIEKKIEYNTPNFKNFYEQRRVGENSSYICNLIRNDLVEEFIAHVNRNNISLSSSICNSIFETNNYLMYKTRDNFYSNYRKRNLIEYATFFGSIQIFQYLKFNKVELQPILWIYAVHGNNPEIIHILEEEKVEMPTILMYYNYEFDYETEYRIDEVSCLFCLERSIQCHHNDIAHYFEYNYFNDTPSKIDDISFKYSNYEFMPNDFVNHFYIYKYCCIYDYIDILRIAFKELKEQITECIKNEKNEILQYQKKNNYWLNTDSVDPFKLAASKNNVEIVDLLLSEYKPTVFPHCYKGNSNLKHITIPSYIIELENDAFNHCESLSCIKFLSSLISIGDYAFYKCKSLKQIEIPSSVMHIGKSAFQDSGIIEITIPSSIIQICDKTFSGCDKLEKVLFSSIEIIGKYAFFKCKSITSILIPSSVTKIDDYAFAECSSLRELTIPSSVKKIGHSIWEGCNSLTKVFLQFFTQKLEGNSFKNLVKLEEIELPSSLTIIDSYLFQNCISLKTIQIPSSVVIIENNAFENCISLNEIIINSEITTIGSNAFLGCSSLISFEFPSSLNSIGSFAFKGCSLLKKINILSSSLSLGVNCFEDCSSLEQINLNCEIIKFNKCLFKNCSQLKEIIIPNSVTYFGPHCFENCFSLKSIIIPSNVIKICEFAFAGCSSLEQISFPSNLKSIGRNAFDCCSSLKRIDMPNIKSIGKDIFIGCSSLSQISIPSNVNLKNSGIDENVKLIKY